MELYLEYQSKAKGTISMTNDLKFDDLNEKQQACIRLIATSKNVGLDGKPGGKRAGDGHGDSFTGATASALVKRGWLKTRLSVFGKYVSYLLTDDARAAYLAAQQPAPAPSLREQTKVRLEKILATEDAEPAPSTRETPADEPAPQAPPGDVIGDPANDPVQLRAALKASQEGAMYFMSERDAARVECAALRAALKPFAEQAKRLAMTSWPDGAQIPPFVAYYITNGDIRRAAQALDSTEVQS